MALLLATSLALHGCDNERASTAISAPSAATGPSAVLSPADVPPIGVTFELAFAEDVFIADFNLHAAAWIAASAQLWQATEGQVYIAGLNITDDVNPGSMSGDLLGSYDAPGLDVVVWDLAQWNSGPSPGFVAFDPVIGRSGRVMALQPNPGTDIILHEIFHMLFVLSWTYYQMSSIEATLDDEYLFTPDDLECVMEASYSPTLRLCSGGALPNANHLVSPSSTPPNSAQVLISPVENGQPRSCWEQILVDYPAFTYTGANASPWPVPPTNVVITNAGIK